MRQLSIHRVGRANLSAASLALAVSIATNAQAQWTVTRLNPIGIGGSQAQAISHGQQGGAAYASGGRPIAGIWSGSAATWVNLNPPTASESQVRGVFDGRQVGDAMIGGTTRAILWNETGEWVDLHPAGASQSAALCIQAGQEGGYAVVNGKGHASHWRNSAETWLDLHPAGARESVVSGLSGERQVGYATMLDGFHHAVLWSGSAESWVDLNPSVAEQSFGWGMDGEKQVGDSTINGVRHAGVWSGTADSWVDLNPDSQSMSVGIAVFRGQQVGFVARAGQHWHATLWNGTAESCVDLTAFLPGVYSTDSFGLAIWSDSRATYVVGMAAAFDYEAVLWTSCPANFNRDGAVDFFDYDQFVQCFEGGSCPPGRSADFDGDGSVDFFDYDNFVRAFEAGC